MNGLGTKMFVWFLVAVALVLALHGIGEWSAETFDQVGTTIKESGK